MPAVVDATFAAAHERLHATCSARDWHRDREDPTQPETVQAMQIVLNLPKQDTPARHRVLEAAARAVVAVCLDERAGGDSAFATALDRWYSHRIRKVVRRSRNKAWNDVQALPGVTVDVARAFAPSAVHEIDPLISKLQIGHTDLLASSAGEPDSDAPVIYVDASLGMSAGKAAAQVGHGSMLLAASLDTQAAWEWKQAGFALSVHEVDHATFERAAKEPGAVVVVDAGFTEIAPDSATVCALPRPLSAQ